MPAGDELGTLRRGAWRMMRRALWANKGWLIAGVCNSLLWGGLKMVVPMLTGDAIDDGLDPYDLDVLLAYGLAIIVMVALVAVVNAFGRYALFALSLRVETDLRQELFTHLQRLHFGYHDGSQTGQLMARATTDLKQMQMMVMFLPILAANVMMMVTVTIVLLTMSPTLTFFALISLPVLFLVTNRFSSRLQPEARDLQQRLAELSGHVEESVTGVRVVKGFGAEPTQNRRLGVLAGNTYDQAMRIARLRANFTPLMEVLPTLGLVAILYVGGRQVIDGDLTVGELLAFNVYIMTLVIPLRWLAQGVASVVRGMESAVRVWDVLRHEPAIVEPSAPTRLEDARGEIDLEDVHFAYDGGPPVLRGLDLHIDAGETVAIVGQTGSGKTTIARILPRFYEPQSGVVRIDGVDVATMPLRDLRRAISLVFEDTFLFTDTIRENIAFGRSGATDDEVRRAANLAGAAEFIESLPEGYDTMLGEGGFSLSGGQRQRLAIARAVITDPRVLILDDATSAVDPSKEHEIRASLEEVAAGRTTIIISHRPVTLALADRVLLLDGGRIAAQGSHDELLATSALYRSVLARANADDAGGVEAALP